MHAVLCSPVKHHPPHHQENTTRGTRLHWRQRLRQQMSQAGGRLIIATALASAWCSPGAAATGAWVRCKAWPASMACTACPAVHLTRAASAVPLGKYQAGGSIALRPRLRQQMSQAGGRIIIATVLASAWCSPGAAATGAWVRCKAWPASSLHACPAMHPTWAAFAVPLGKTPGRGRNCIATALGAADEPGCSGVTNSLRLRLQAPGVPLGAAADGARVWGIAWLACSLHACLAVHLTWAACAEPLREHQAGASAVAIKLPPLTSPPHEKEPAA